MELINGKKHRGRKSKLEENNTIGSTGTSPRKGNLFGKTQCFGRRYPNGYTSSDSYTSGYHMGSMTTQKVYSRYQSIYPPPWTEIDGTSPISNGNRGFIMQPLLSMGNFGLVNTNGTSSYGHIDYKESARLMGMWRTGDQTFFTGERVTDAEGNAYRAFRVYKVGGDNTGTTGYDYWNYDHHHSRSTVYLFPEGGT